MLDLNAFSDYNVKKALLKFNGNLQKATNWLLSFMDEDLFSPSDSLDDFYDISNLDSLALNKLY